MEELQKNQKKIEFLPGIYKTDFTGLKLAIRDYTRENPNDCPRMYPTPSVTDVEHYNEEAKKTMPELPNNSIIQISAYLKHIYTLLHIFGYKNDKGEIFIIWLYDSSNEIAHIYRIQ